MQLVCICRSGFALGQLKLHLPADSVDDTILLGVIGNWDPLELAACLALALVFELALGHSLG